MISFFPYIKETVTESGNFIKEIHYLQSKKPPYLILAHLYWKAWVCPGDTVIDATVGNGHDTLFLARLLNGHGELIGYDIQPQAIEHTQIRLEALSDAQRAIVVLRQQSHALFSEKGAKLIVYNLGYLPGGNKSVTTKTASTLSSLQRALEMIGEEGAISITCYPGHPEGEKEEKNILAWVKTLPAKQWQVCYHQWPNRDRSPSLFFLTHQNLSFSPLLEQLPS